ncbi:hypothetical protein BT96DRAFT_1001739 [Gymnopus androsaceus JB14]|uniref:Uncharacterized protein n=1 Tax=Gymnopus androsaceus JB14 TaxID=1447944 RepID=A0A6A4GYM7_9AGAR|nr:hypothetical protein BT96DRAFT_1001739 [Gymnopus androsaceus JB14]
MSFRQTLAPFNSVFENYPQNLALPLFFRLPSITLSSIHELALLHLLLAPEEDSTGPPIGGMLKHIITGFLVYANIREQPVWFYSNLSAAGMDQVALDPTQLQMFFNSTSTTVSQTWPVHFIQTYTLRNGGTMFHIQNMDNQMWDAIEEELNALRNAKGPNAACEVGRRYY